MAKVNSHRSMLKICTFSLYLFRLLRIQISGTKGRKSTDDLKEIKQELEININNLISDRSYALIPN